MIIKVFLSFVKNKKKPFLRMHEVRILVVKLVTKISIRSLKLTNVLSNSFFRKSEIKIIIKKNNKKIKIKNSNLLKLNNWINYVENDQNHSVRWCKVKKFKRSFKNNGRKNNIQLRNQYFFSEFDCVDEWCFQFFQFIQIFDKHK